MKNPEDPSWRPLADVLTELQRVNTTQREPMMVRVEVVTRRELERARRDETESRADNIARADAIRAVPCPRCGAEVGRKCRTSTGARMPTWSGSHAPRLKLAGAKVSTEPEARRKRAPADDPVIVRPDAASHERYVTERARQGLGPTVTDPVVRDYIAAILGSALPPLPARAPEALEGP